MTLSSRNQLVIDKLTQNYGLSLRDNKGRCRCPGHNGTDKNLVVRIENNLVLTHCKSHNCEHKDIVKALIGETQQHEPIVNKQGHYNDLVRETAYPYVTVNGEEIWQVRKDFSDGSKRITTVPSGVRGKCLPFKSKRLANLDQSQSIIICEGEKDTAALENAGFIATTNKGGANAVSLTDWSMLEGRSNIVIWADADSPGKEWEDVLTTTLLLQGCGLKRVLVNHSDETKLGAADFTVEQIKEHVKHAETIPSPYIDYSVPELATLEESKRDWLVNEAILEGGFFIFTAKPKSGKSTLGRQLAVAIGNGIPWLGRETKQAKVTYMGFEDRAYYTSQHLNEKMFANRKDLRHENVRIVVDLPQIIGVDKRLQWLEHYIKFKKPEMVLIDTLFKFIEVADANNYTEILSVLLKLKGVSERTKCAIGAMHHSRKSTGEDKIDSCLGSSAIAGTFEGIFLIKKSKNPFSAIIESQLRGGENFENCLLELDRDSAWFELKGSQEEIIADEIRATLKDFFHNILFNNQGRKFHELSDELPPKIIERAKELKVDLDHILTQSELLELLDHRRNGVIKELKKMLQNPLNNFARIGTGKRGDKISYYPK